MFGSCHLRLLVLMSLPLMCQAQQGGDYQAQILYAFHSEDTNQLMNLVQTLNTQVKGGATDAATRYHLAHADYRLGLLEGKKGAKLAEPALGECIDELKEVLRQDAAAPEALALQSACYAELAGLKRLEAVFLRSRAEDRIDAAAKLAPRNPRVVFLRSQEALARARPGSVDNQRALTELKLAVELFDASSATRIDVPGWGHAEAYLAYGMQLQAHGDVLGARNWIEKSLIVAPDYKAAQRQAALMVRH